MCGIKYHSTHRCIVGVPMNQHHKHPFFVLLTTCMLCAGGCSSSQSPREEGGAAREPTTRTQPPSQEYVEQTSTPSSQQTREVQTQAPTAITTAPVATATVTIEVTPDDVAQTEVPEFSADSCIQSPNQNCLETFDEAPLGAAPPRSEVTENAYPYTVRSYLEWVINDLHTKWNRWFVTNNFVESQVFYKFIFDTDPPHRMNCTGPMIPHDHPNAYYCGSDPDAAARGTLENGMMIFPITTMQRMWTGEVLGKPSKTAGDFAAAIIAAHEYGHSVTDELGIQWEKYYPGQLRPFTGSNKEAIADCFAGAWMNTTYYEGVLEPGDFEEAVAALNAVGAPQPGSSHPTAPERDAALKAGYNTGDPMHCVDIYWK